MRGNSICKNNTYDTNRGKNSIENTIIFLGTQNYLLILTHCRGRFKIIYFQNQYCTLLNRYINVINNIILTNTDFEVVVGSI